MLAALVAAISFNLTAKADATLPPASDKKDVTYASDIKAIFDVSCVKCHSGDHPKARLHMDTLEGVLKGTKEGKIVNVGDSAGSFIARGIAVSSVTFGLAGPPRRSRRSSRR